MTYNTVKKNEIISFLSKNSGQAFTIDDICTRILNDGAGKSTVYRIVARLAEDGVVRRVHNGSGRSASYQYVNTGHCSEHFHLKCNDCGRLIHLDDITSHILETRILRSEGFSLDGGMLLYGKCKNCTVAASEGEK